MTQGAQQLQHDGPQSRLGGSTVVWRFVEGTPGHEKQSAGLLQGLSQRVAVEFITVDVRHAGWRQEVATAPDPDLLIGAGHRVHVPMLWSRWRRGGRCVVLMKPSIPTFCFDLVLVPEHDHVWFANSVIFTEGTLSPVEVADKPGDRGVVLLGGESRHFAWQDAGIAELVRAAVAAAPEISWTVADSRRTPPATRELLTEQTDFDYVHYADTDVGWLTQQLARASYVWVTADSVSMLYEAMASGASVGVLDLRPLNPDNKLVNGIDQLVERQVVAHSSNSLQLPLRGLIPPLREHERCADLIVRRFLAG